MSDNFPKEIEGITLVTERSRDVLNKRQILDYRSHRERLLRWMLNLGKNPDQAEGYAYHTARRRADDIDKFYRWKWGKSSYTTNLTHDDADAYMKELAYADESTSYKTNIQKTLKMLFRWRAWEFDEDEWEPKLTFSDSGGATQPRDFLSREERQLIREAALEYGSVPHYNSLTPEERREWKQCLARRFRKPMDEIAKVDFERANGYKIPSLVWTSLDAGLRPVEVQRATVKWIDLENAVLRIPAKQAAKSNEHWTVSLQQRTADVLAQWLEERELYEKYAGENKIWLTREDNPYRSHSLKYVLEKLCNLASIPTENRSISWYAIRHSVGTYMAREEGLAAAQAQLRHTSVQTTMKYDQTPIEDRRDALNRIG